MTKKPCLWCGVRGTRNSLLAQIPYRINLIDQPLVNGQSVRREVAAEGSRWLEYLPDGVLMLPEAEP